MSKQRQGQRRLEMQRQWKNRPHGSLKGAGKWQVFRACVRSPLLQVGDLGDYKEVALKVSLKVGNRPRPHLLPDASSVIPLIFQSRRSVSVEQASESLLKSKACFGAENLMRVLGNYCRLGEVRTHIRVGVVGKALGEVMGPRLLPWAGASFGKRILGTLYYLSGEERSSSGRVL